MIQRTWNITPNAGHEVFEVASFPFHIGEIVYNHDTKDMVRITGITTGTNLYISYTNLGEQAEHTISPEYLFKDRKAYDELMTWYPRQPGCMISEYHPAIVFKPGNSDFKGQVFSRMTTETLYRDIFGCPWNRDIHRVSSVPFKSIDEIVSLLDSTDSKSFIVYVEELRSGREVRAEFLPHGDTYQHPIAVSTDPTYPVIYDFQSYYKEDTQWSRGDCWVARSKPKSGRPVRVKPYGQPTTSKWMRTSGNHLYCGLCDHIKWDGKETIRCPICNSIMEESDPVIHDETRDRYL